MRSTAICTPTRAVLPIMAAAPDNGCIVPIRYGFGWANTTPHGTAERTAPPSAAALVASTRRRVIAPPGPRVSPVSFAISPPSPVPRESTPIGPPDCARCKLQVSGRPRYVAIAQIAAARAVPVVIGLERDKAVVAGQLGLPFQPVEARRVAAEDCGLERTVGRSQRLEPVFLLHV